MERLPLSVHLSRRVTRLIDELEAATLSRHPAVPLATWINVMQRIGSDEVAQNELPERGRISRRAVRFRLAAMERQGLATLRSNPPGTRGKVVRLTSHGGEVLESHRPPYDDVEARWRKRAGQEKVDALRDTLRSVVARFELEHPHVPEGYGPVDPRIMGGPGQDWKPVPRGDGDTVSSLSLVALLSQALCSFAVDYERAKGPSLMHVANVFRLVDDDGLTVADLVDRSRAEIALGGLERHGFITIDPETVVRLTAIGAHFRDTYEETVEAIERGWEERFGADDVRALRSALEALSLPDDDALPHFFNFQAFWLGGPLPR